MVADVVTVDCEYVESRERARGVHLEEVGGRGTQARALADVDCGERAAVRRARASLHFDEDEHAAVARDQIDLAARAADVAPDDDEAGPREIAFRERFAGAAERAAGAQESVSENGSVKRTETKPRRWCSHGPCSRRAAR